MTNADRRTHLTDLYTGTAHPLHTALYKLHADSRADPGVSRALRASLGTVCAAVSALTEALNATVDLLEEQAQAAATTD